MHDRTRRLLCRSAFFAVCVLPTLVVAAWCHSRASAGYRESCAIELSQTLGLRASLSGVSYPRPGVTLYAGVELADAETAAPLARLRFLEVGGGETAVGLVASQAEVDAAQLGRLWEVIQSKLKISATAATTIRLVAGEVTLHLPDGSQTLAETQGQLDAKPGPSGERTASIGFRLAGVPSAEPIRLRCARKLKDGRVATSIEINTGGAAVPCWLLLEPLGIVNHLGDRARFRGTVWVADSADGWEGELSGQLTGVDLDRVVTEQFPHRLSGEAIVTIQKAKFRRGRLEEATGDVAAGPGVVSPQFIAAAAENLHLTRGDSTSMAPSSSAETGATGLPYDQLALGFTIDRLGLELRGGCDQPPGAILRSGAAAMLAEGTDPAGPVVGLLRALAPQSEVQVPATRESDWLMQLLPIPQIKPMANTPPHGKIRLAPRPVTGNDEG